MYDISVYSLNLTLCMTITLWVIWAASTVVKSILCKQTPSFLLKQTGFHCHSQFPQEYHDEQPQISRHQSHWLRLL